MSTPVETAVELARLRTELHATNTNVGRIATSIERITTDHETRIRALESEQARVIGVVRLLAWLGGPTVAGILIFMAQRAH